MRGLQLFVLLLIASDGSAFDGTSNLLNDISQQLSNILSNFFDLSEVENILFSLVSQLDLDTLQQIVNLYNNLTTQINSLIQSEFDPIQLCDYVQKANISNGCKSQAEVICRNTTLLLTLLDASSKIYPGVLYGSKLDYGNFDECLSIDHWKNGTRVMGKFCANGVIIPTDLNGTEFDIFTNAFKLSVCIPNQCTATDILALFHLPRNLPLLDERFCTTKETDTEFSSGDIIVGTIFLGFIVLMVSTTLYDYYLHTTDSEPQYPFLIAFSLLTNVKKLMKTAKSSEEHVTVFNGIKFISMMWIIAGHGFLAITYEIIPISNNDDYKNFRWRRYTQYMTTAYLGVDTFFFISGFLLAYQYLKQKPKSFKRHATQVPFLYFYRYLRLTPALLMVYLFTLTLNDHTGLGPMSHYAREVYIKEPCYKYWWSFFLYIQNYFNYREVCLVQTWYLSADMQMFFIAPLILIPVAMQIKRNFKLVMVELFVLNVILTGAPICIALYFRNYENPFEIHSRLVDFFVGLMLGAYMREKKKIIISERTNIFLWTVTLLGMFAVILGYQEVEINQGFVAKTVYHSIRKPIWCLGLCWIVVSCHHGYGGFVNWLLTRSPFQVGGRLTYCMYLVHCNVIAIYIYNVKERMHFSDYEVFYIFCGHLTVTLVVAVFWTLAFESPLITIQKLLFRPKELSGKRGVTKTPKEGKGTEIDHIE